MRVSEVIYIFQKNQRKPKHHIFSKEEIHMAFFDGIHDYNAMAFNAGKNRLRVTACLGIGALVAD